MFNFKNDHYYDFREVTDFLKQAKKSHPNLFSFESIGKTTEKRDIWMATVTNSKTGAADTKPAFFIDANTHASEIAGTQCALYFIHRVLKNFGKDEDITYMLDHMTFYVIPRLSADGAEFFLKKNQEVRTTPVAWPLPSPHENFDEQDIDGNGEVLTMRIPDAAGAFKISEKNSRLMTQRSHTDIERKKTSYYKLYDEGQFKNFDGFTENHHSVFGFDLNRQFPGSFRPEGEQVGAGPYPMFLPEAKALVKTFTEKNRIGGHITLHTYGGLILRPSASHPDENFHFHDIEIYKNLLSSASNVSGYKGLSVFKDFRYLPRECISGSADDWSFEHRGVFAFTVEIWDIWKQAGVEVKDDVSRYFNPKENELLKIYDWAAKNLKPGEYYTDWKPFQHPQLGPVEIGGWKTNFLFRNPPKKYLKQETEKVFEIIMSHAKSLPLVKIKKTTTEKLPSNLTRVTVIVENRGFLPTNGSEQALKMKAVNEPFFEVKLPKSLKLVTGKRKDKAPHLKGRARFLPWHTPMFPSNGNPNEVKLEWLVEGHGSFELHGDFARGGTVAVNITL